MPKAPSPIQQAPTPAAPSPIQKAPTPAPSPVAAPSPIRKIEKRQSTPIEKAPTLSPHKPTAAEVAAADATLARMEAELAAQIRKAAAPATPHVVTGPQKPRQPHSKDAPVATPQKAGLFTAPPNTPADRCDAVVARTALRHAELMTRLQHLGKRRGVKANPGPRPRPPGGPTHKPYEFRESR